MKNAAAKTIEFGTPVHLPFQHLQPVDLSRNRTVAPGLRQGGPNRRDIVDDPGGKAVQRSGLGRRQPAIERCRIALAQDAIKLIDGLRRGADLGRESGERVDKLPVGSRQRLVGGRDRGYA